MNAASGTQSGLFASAYETLRSELYDQLAPLTLESGAAVGLVVDSIGSIDWFVPCQGCSCSTDGKQRLLGNQDHCDRLVIAGTPLRRGDLDFRVVVCATKNDAALANLLLNLTSTLIDRLNLHQHEGLLLDELVRSWQSLDIIANLNLDLRTLQTREQRIHRLLDCAVACAHGLSVILWVQEQDRLVLADARNAEPANSREVERGLVGRALNEGSAQTLTLPKLSDLDLDVEPELKESGFAAAIPVRTPGGLKLALQVWNRLPEAPLDSSHTRFLLTLAVHAALVIENDRLQRAAIEGERIRHEAELGFHIQQSLLLGQVPDDLKDLEVANVMVPARQVAGDFYDFIRPGRDCFDVVVGDVMGKGIAAALLAAATKDQILRQHVQPSDASSHQNTSPAEIVQAVNQSMAKRFITLNSFATLLYVRFDPQSGQATFVDAGHTPLLRLRSSDRKVEVLHGSNLPLGVAADEKYSQTTVELAEGDVYVLYTDGVTQAQAADGSFYGEERLLQLLEENPEGTPGEIAARICNGVIYFGSSDILDDDLTCVVVKVISAKSHGRRAEIYLETIAQVEELPAIRMWLRQFCSDHTATSPGLDAVLDKLELAWQEALTNVVRHGLKGVADKRLQLRASLEKDRIILEAFHFGHPFDPAMVNPPVFDGSQGHGFGVYLIAQLTDEQDYSRDADNRSCIRLVKYFGREK